MSFSFHSHSQLETLAERLFETLFDAPAASEPAGVFAKRDCVVVPSRIMEGWLRQRYLFGPTRVPGSGGIIADCDFPLLNVFVNDWLYRMDRPEADRRDPAAHPFAPESLQWRLFLCLREYEERADPDLEDVLSFIKAAGDNPVQREQRRFQLAARLAAVFDGYTVYRPEMLLKWQDGDLGDLPENLRWQHALWRRLTEGDLKDKTYLTAFRKMQDRAQLAQCGIQDVYRAVHVFCPAIMPRVYQVFLLKLGELLPVCLYLFNPSETGWIVEGQEGQAARVREACALEAHDEEASLFSRSNPLLSGLGRGVHEFLSELLDFTEGQSADPACSTADTEQARGASALSSVQQAVVNNDASLNGADKDNSIQVHVCHSPRRELEVLRDHMLRWFTKHKYQPRDIQALVPDMAAYAPYIEAVFGTSRKDAPDTIPFVIADRVRVGESLVAEGFMRLLLLADSRFTAADIVGMLQCDCMGRKFGIAQDEVERIAEMIAAAGIRWGRGAAHREQVTEVSFTEATTWRHGLDRLLKGYLLGSLHAEVHPTSPWPCDIAEGDDALRLGRLAQFVGKLGAFADYGAARHTIGEWVDRLGSVVDEFFVVDNESFRDVGLLRRAVDALGKSADAAEAADLQAGIGIIRTFMQTHLQSAASGADVTNNVVVFSALRLGSSTPRKAICLLGMGDGAFPRRDSRPAYDLQKKKRKRCDRTPRIDDRTAFLEALLSARDVFYLSYPGFSESDNQSAPSSTLIRELLEFAGASRCTKVEHRLQAFNPVYFINNPADKRFSYSRENGEAARILLARQAGYETTGDRVSQLEAPPVAAPQTARLPETRQELDIEQLIGFFKNPARHYYRDVLGARFDRQNALVLPDQEEFDPDSLADYTVREAIIKAQIADDVNAGAMAERVFQQLTEQGQLPLGQWGREWFAGKWTMAETLLAAQVADYGTLKDILRRQQDGAMKNLLVEAEYGTVYGTLQSFSDGAQPAALHFRCVSPTAKGKMAAWLRHVLACAANLGMTSLCFEGKALDNKKYESLALRPIEPGKAREWLQCYMELYRAGQLQTLCFTEKASYAYVHALRHPSARKAAVTTPEQAALVAARKAWCSGFMASGDDADAYMLRAFGADGPFANADEFAQTAKDFWEPFFDFRADLEIAEGARRN